MNEVTTVLVSVVLEGIVDVPVLVHSVEEVREFDMSNGQRSTFNGWKS